MNIFENDSNEKIISTEDSLGNENLIFIDLTSLEEEAFVSPSTSL